jgi:hypothetical protein
MLLKDDCLEFDQQQVKRGLRGYKYPSPKN